MKGACNFLKNEEFHNFNNIINNLNLKILEHGLLTTDSEWKFKQLTSPFNRLYFVLSGSAKIQNAQNDIELKSGNAYLIPLNNSFDYICDDFLHKFYVHFRIELLSGNDLFQGCKNCFTIPIDVDYLNDLIRQLKRGEITDYLYCKGVLLQYISRLIVPLSSNIKEQIYLTNKYSNVYKYINDNCTAELRVSEIAEKYNLSLTNLSKSFKKDTGENIKKIINNKLLTLSQDLLLTTDMSVKEIASSLKFVDEFYFSKFFKRATGIAPHNFRQRSNHFK